MMYNDVLVSEVKQRIYFSDTDAGGVVYYGNLSRYLEIGFSEWFRKYVGSLRLLNERYNIFFAVKESNQSFKKSIYYDDEICIKTVLKSIKFYSISFKTEVIVNGKVCFWGENTLTPVDINTKLPVKLPQEILKFMKED